MLYLLLCSLLFLVVNCEFNKLKCEKDLLCPALPKHYKELGCTPVLTENECCPYFECPNLENLDNDKCFYHKESYERGEKLPGEKLAGLCNAECVCEKY